jgi:hypothetical protein
VIRPQDWFNDLHQPITSRYAAPGHVAALYRSAVTAAINAGSQSETTKEW